MTEEQIKQNAEAYANDEKQYYIEIGCYDLICEAHIAGAHSRDEEIYDLKRDIEDLQEMVKMRSTAFACARNEIERLSNPWISVEEGLPEHKRPIIFKCADKAYGGWYNEEMKAFQTKAPDGTNWAMARVTFWYYQSQI